MFTRGPEELRQTAVFVGGADVAAGEALLRAVTECFFGPLRVSVMLDANGANTTAAAAVIAAGRHVCLGETSVLVLGATGPVGQRVAQLLAAEGAAVRAGSRSQQRAESICARIRSLHDGATLTAVQTADPAQTRAALEGVNVVIAAGAPAVELVSTDQLRQAAGLKVVIDLNAVPPLGLGGVEATDRASQRNAALCYGALGVGRDKMKLHKACIQQLFTANNHVLDAMEVYQIGRQLQTAGAF
jgi:NADPH:quinone reductase-like Zn-dependent oxidoreductase